MNLRKEIRRVALLSGTFTLRSGARSDLYFDKYQFEARPNLLRAITEAMVPLIPTDVDVVAGLELGGVPIATLLSQLTGLPAAFVRKEPKQYGTCRYAEGTDLTNKSIALIEDVVTSGGAVLEAAGRLRYDGFHPSVAICVIDREAGAEEKLLATDLPLISLFTMSDIENAA